VIVTSTVDDRDDSGQGSVPLKFRIARNKQVESLIFTLESPLRSPNTPVIPVKAEMLVDVAVSTEAAAVPKETVTGEMKLDPVTVTDFLPPPEPLDGATPVTTGRDAIVIVNPEVVTGTLFASRVWRMSTWVAKVSVEPSCAVLDGLTVIWPSW